MNHVCLLICACLLLPITVQAQLEGGDRILRALTAERQMLTAELEEYQRTIRLLHSSGSSPSESANPAVRKLAHEVANLQERLVTIAEQEVTLLQRQVIAEKQQLQVTSVNQTERPPQEQIIESKPLQTHSVDYTLAQEAENVERLHQLLENYYTDLQESARVLPTQEEMARREVARRDAETMDRIPFSVDKVRLSGAEGSAALADISRRLMDPTVPESRRDIAPICSIKTRLFDTLVASENRSLKPVGKNHYIARIRLQPGITTLSIRKSRWEVSLPHHAIASDFLVTLYRPHGGTEELHVFTVDDLIATAGAHIPA
ncbi:MAG: hypothetical protein ACI9NT_002326, partial [Bacteroidia bacterium]